MLSVSRIVDQEIVEEYPIIAGLTSDINKTNRLFGGTNSYSPDNAFSFTQDDIALANSTSDAQGLAAGKLNRERALSDGSSNQIPSPDSFSQLANMLENPTQYSRASNSVRFLDQGELNDPPGTYISITIKMYNY